MTHSQYRQQAYDTDNWCQLISAISVSYADDIENESWDRSVSAAQMNSVLVHTLHVADHNNYPL